MRKTFTLLATILIVIFTIVSFTQCGGKNNQEKIDKEIHEGLAILAMQMNAQAPVMLDDITRFDRSEVKGKELISYYTILANTEAIDKNSIKEHILKGLKNNPETVALSQSDVIYIYIFRDSDGNDFHTFSIEAADFE